jgi:hypothetical protein
MRLRRQRRRRRGPIVAAAGAATGLGGLAAFAVVRRRRARANADARVEWTCACGEAYLVQGSDRHRIYWLPDAAIEDPLLDRQCVACGAPLSESAVPAA